MPGRDGARILNDDLCVEICEVEGLNDFMKLSRAQIFFAFSKRTEIKIRPKTLNIYKYLSI